MNTREKRKQKKQRDIDNFEANLKLHYEAMQNELNTIIRNTIPRQLTMLRTLMWVNVVFLYLASRSFDMSLAHFMLLVTIGISFAMSFYSMLFGRSFLYGNSQKLKLMDNIYDGDWSKTHGLRWMMYNVQRAIRYNGLIIIKRTRLIAQITFVTFFSLFLLGICYITNINTSEMDNEWQKNQNHTLHHQEVVEEKEESGIKLLRNDTFLKVD